MSIGRSLYESTSKADCFHAPHRKAHFDGGGTIAGVMRDVWVDN
jgi:hypothetical protein